MPSLFSVMGYKVFFWSSENGEPIHVHVCKGTPAQNATKIWISSTGTPVLCHNRSRVPDNILRKIMNVIHSNYLLIQTQWVASFSYITFYC